MAAGATLSQSGATTLAAGRLLENAGTYQFLSDTFAFEGVAPAPSIHNAGTISKTGGAVEATIFVGLANAGTVTSTSGQAEPVQERARSARPGPSPASATPRTRRSEAGRSRSAMP